MREKLKDAEDATAAEVRKAAAEQKQAKTALEEEAKAKHSAEKENEKLRKELAAAGKSIERLEKELQKVKEAMVAAQGDSSTAPLRVWQAELLAELGAMERLVAAGRARIREECWQA